MCYGSINKMLEQGLIEESDDRPDPHLDRHERRRYYRITSYGRKDGAVEAAGMRELVQLAAAYPGSRAMPESGFALHLYRRLLKLYPPGFRENSGDAMERSSG